jgi:hypothetical protein
MAHIKGVRQQLKNCTVAQLPNAALHKGDTVYVTNALRGAEATGSGSGNLAFSNGAIWIRVDTGIQVSA